MKKHMKQKKVQFYCGLGLKLRHLRERKGYSLDDLAKKTGYSVRKLLKMETTGLRFRVMRLDQLWDFINTTGYRMEIKFCKRPLLQMEPPYPLHLIMDKARP